MFEINELDDLERLESSHRVVLVFLADRLNADAIRWIADVWGEIHERSGMRWHVAVPVDIGTTRTGGQFAPNAFDSKLARRLAQIYGLSELDFPCLVLDSFIEGPQLKIALPDTEKERRELVLSINSFLDDEVRSIGRQEVMDDLFNHLQRRATTRGLVSFVPNAISAAARAIAGTVG